MFTAYQVKKDLAECRRKLSKAEPGRATPNAHTLRQYRNCHVLQLIDRG